MQKAASGSGSRAMTTEKGCDLCHGEFVVETPKGYTPCPCVKQRDRLAKFQALISRADALPGQTFEAYKPRTKVQKDALEDVMQEHRGLYLYGPKGTGKSHLMNATVLRAANMRIPAVLISVPRLLYEIRNDKSREIEKAAMSIAYLALDDIGKQAVGKNYNWVDERLFMLLDERYKLWQRGVAVTSFTSQYQMNKREEEDGLEDLMDPAVVDRIRHMCLNVRLDGESFRKGA